MQETPTVPMEEDEGQNCLGIGGKACLFLHS